MNKSISTWLLFRHNIQLNIIAELRMRDADCIVVVGGWWSSMIDVMLNLLQTDHCSWFECKVLVNEHLRCVIPQRRIDCRLGKVDTRHRMSVNSDNCGSRSLCPTIASQISSNSNLNLAVNLEHESLVLSHFCVSSLYTKVRRCFCLFYTSH